MSDKRTVPLHFTVSIEERFYQPTDRRWHAQFMFYPLGYFRGDGGSPAHALTRAWRKFRKQIDPGKRWWSVVLNQQVPLPRW